MNLVDLIPFGRENKVNRHDLIRAYALATNHSESVAEREFHKFLACCRLDHVIISTGDGYYRPLADRPDEIEETIHFTESMMHRGRETIKNASYAQKWLEDVKAGRL